MMYASPRRKLRAVGLSLPLSTSRSTSWRSFSGFPFSDAEIARVIENCALAMSPLVFAVGSQLAAAVFCAASGAAVTAPIVKAAAMLLRIAFIRDLPASNNEGVG